MKLPEMVMNPKWMNAWGTWNNTGNDLNQNIAVQDWLKMQKCQSCSQATKGVLAHGGWRGYVAGAVICHSAEGDTEGWSTGVTVPQGD